MSHESPPFPQWFPATHWSLVRRAGSAGDESQALDELLRIYLPALKAHLVGRKRIAPDRAEDLLQGFILSKVLAEGLIARADGGRGKFRSFLLTALDHYIVSEFRKDAAAKRGPGPAGMLNVEEHADDLHAARTGPASFDVAWARELISETLRRMEADCRAVDREQVWEVFECRIVSPLLDGIEPLPYEALIARFGFESPAQAFNVLVTAKRMFARVLRSVVGEYVDDEAAVDVEIKELRTILSSC